VSHSNVIVLTLTVGVLASSSGGTRSPVRRQALDALRRRGISSFLRSHAPLPLLLLLAAREGRLFWRSRSCFAVLYPLRVSLDTQPSTVELFPS
jgi:hypothetical protein